MLERGALFELGVNVQRGYVSTELKSGGIELALAFRQLGVFRDEFYLKQFQRT